jgi:hypothetical protein
MKMRQSTLNSALGCAHKLTYMFDPTIPYYNSVVRAMGTAVHAGHEAYYNHRKETGEVHTEVRPWLEAALVSFQDEIERAEDRFDWRLEPAKPHLKTPKKEVLLDFDSAARKIAAGLVHYHANKCYWPEGYSVLAAELSFDLPWEDKEDWIRHGTIDLVLTEDATGDVILVDHKTSKAPPKAGKYSAASTPQASYYLDAFQRLDLVDPFASIEFVYDVLTLNPPGKEPKFDRIREPRSPAQIKTVQMQAELLIDLIDAGGPFMPNTDSFLCSQMYCDYWDRCPYGSTLKG